MPDNLFRGTKHDCVEGRAAAYGPLSKRSHGQTVLKSKWRHGSRTPAWEQLWKKVLRDVLIGSDGYDADQLRPH